MIEIICKYCKKIIKAYPSRLRRKKYCSKKCKYVDGNNFHPSKATLGKMSQAHKKIGYKNDGYFKKGIIPYFKLHPEAILRAEKHPQWKGGITKTIAGYIWVHKLKHPKANHGYIYEHRYILEQYLNRYLKSHEQVHHLGKKDDNRLCMLMAFNSNSAHKRFHKNPNNVKLEEIIFDGRKF